MESLNRMAIELVDEAIDFADELTGHVHHLEGDAAVLDFGVEVPGSLEAGLLLAEITTGGLATVRSGIHDVAGAPLTHVDLATDHPALALLCSGKAGWELAVGDFEGLGSGPARALVAEEDVFGRVGYREDFDMAVLAVETETLPDEAVAGAVAERAGVPESAVFLPAYRSASLTGSVMGASRAAELATFRLSELGYDPADVLSVSARAPVPPVPREEATAMARATDAVAYGGEVHLTLDADFERIDEIVSTAGVEHGVPFVDVFESVDWDYASLPVDLFAPAQVTVDVVAGDTYVLGDTHEEILAESFGLH
ncbi:MAG: methenyltetrahydromethanopterin cyclohydrolase [Haloarculaceae archaeon]